MSNVTLNSGSPDLFNAETDPSVFKAWMDSIPGSHKPKKHSAIAIVIQKEIQPILVKNESQIFTEGAILPSELTKSPDFINLKTKVLPKNVDPEFGPILNSSDLPVKESIVRKNTTEKVNKVSIVILCVGSAPSANTFKDFCEKAKAEACKTMESLNSPFTISAQVFSSDSPNFSDFNHSSQSQILSSPHDSIRNFIKNSKPTDLNFNPGNGLILKEDFEHGQSQINTKKLFLLLDAGKTITTQETTTHSNFIDIRSRSELQISF